MTPAEVEDPTTPHDAARAFAALGLRVVPVKGKHPPIDAWQKAATTDLAAIDAWWGGLYRRCGVGIATGPGSGVWVLDIDVAGGKRGDETLAALEERHGALPDTVEAQTGSGGRHLYFRWPEGRRPRTTKNIGDGLDARGDGGQVLAPPTVHPNGTPYVWLIGHSPWELPFADAPAWLLDLVDPPGVTYEPDPPRPRLLADGDDSIAAWAPEVTSFDRLLTKHGWTPGRVMPRTDGERQQYWTRPGKDPRDGHSAVLHLPDGPLVVFSSAAGLIDTNAATRSGDGWAYGLFGLLAALEFGGDRSACARALRAERSKRERAATGDPFMSTSADAEPAPEWVETVPRTDETSDERSSWDPIDLTPYIDGTAPEEPMPTVFALPNGRGLFYLDRINLLFGDSGTGKSWLAIASELQMIREGWRVGYLDLEDHPRSIVARFRTLGATDDELRSLDYVRPESTNVAGEALPAVSRMIAGGCRLIVIDSLGEFGGLFGANLDREDEVNKLVQSVLRPIERLGVGLVLIDHVVKNPDAPKGHSAGSFRKRAMVDGASMRVDLLEGFSRERSGKVKITCAKDRLGWFAPHQHVTDVEIRVDRHVELVPRLPDPANAGRRVERPTRLMELVSQYVEACPDLPTGRMVEEAVTGKATFVRRALAALVNEGWMAAEPGARGAVHYRVVTPFRDAEPVDNDPFLSTSSQVVPPRPTSSRDEVKDPNRPRPSSHPCSGTRTRSGLAALDEVPGLDLVPPETSESSPVDKSDPPPIPSYEF